MGRILLCPNLQPMRKATRSPLSLAEGIPLKAIAFPGANPAGDFNHLSKLAADHFMVALDESADE